jgi:hypothetical protein
VCYTPVHYILLRCHSAFRITGSSRCGRASHPFMHCLIWLPGIWFLFFLSPFPFSLFFVLS